MKKHTLNVLLLLFLTTLPSSLFADETAKQHVYQGYSGGMMLHMGYLLGNDNNAPAHPHGATMGIGGALHINLWQYLRIGCEGYVSTMHSGLTDCANTLSKGSYIRSGWGGFLADFCYRGKRAWPFAGATIGGGAMRGLYITNGNQDDWSPESVATLNKQPFFCIDPFVGCDYALTSHVHLTLKLDWLLAIHNTNLLRPTGPRAYIGFMFCR